jgi:hypothetical protein
MLIAVFILNLIVLNFSIIKSSSKYNSIIDDSKNYLNNKNLELNITYLKGNFLSLQNKFEHF